MNKKELIRLALQAIADANDGTIDPNMVLSAAKDKRSPLHDCFDWNDKTAAAKYRINQARDLIRSVKLVVTTETSVISTVCYVRDPDRPGDEQGYVSVSRIRNDEDRKRDVLLQEFSRVAAVLERARDLAKYFGLTEDIDRLVADVERVKEAAEMRVM